MNIMPFPIAGFFYRSAIFTDASIVGLASIPIGELEVALVLRFCCPLIAFSNVITRTDKKPVL